MTGRGQRVSSLPLEENAVLFVVDQHSSYKKPQNAPDLGGTGNRVLHPHWVSTIGVALDKSTTYLLETPASFSDEFQSPSVSICMKVATGSGRAVTALGLQVVQFPPVPRTQAHTGMPVHLLGGVCGCQI